MEIKSLTGNVNLLINKIDKQKDQLFLVTNNRQYDALQVEIDNLNKKLSSHNTMVALTKNAKNKLVEMGYSPEFGARPLKRVIKREIESIIADLILQGEIAPDMQIDFKNAKGFFVK